MYEPKKPSSAMLKRLGALKVFTEEYKKFSTPVTNLRLLFS